MVEDGVFERIDVMPTEGASICRAAGNAVELVFFGALRA